jgi:hypothetical protein
VTDDEATALATGSAHTNTSTADIQAALDRELHGYSTSIGQDQTLLLEAQTLIERTVLEARLERKLVLQQALAFAHTYRDLSSST